MKRSSVCSRHRTGGVLSCFLAIALAAPRPAAADDLNVDFSTRDGQVAAALTALGLASVPAPYNSLLFLERAQKSGFSFRNGRLGGGTTPLQDSNLYVEGYVAFQSYAPEYVIEEPSGDFDLEVRWRSYSATGGLGWSFDLAPGLALRPIANLSFGRVVSNSDVPDDVEAERSDYLAGDGLTAGGYGAALALDYEYRGEINWIDARFRHTHMEMLPLGDDYDPSVTSDAITSAMLLRLRQPIAGSDFGGRPIWSVYELTYARYWGDQGELLNLPWLARAGVGFEFETGQLGRYAPPRVRTMLRYIFGEDFGTFAFGAGITF